MTLPDSEFVITLRLLTLSVNTDVPGLLPALRAPFCIALSITDGVKPRSCILSMAWPLKSLPLIVSGAFLGFGALGFGKLFC